MQLKELVNDPHKLKYWGTHAKIEWAWREAQSVPVVYDCYILVMEQNIQISLY